MDRQSHPDNGYDINKAHDGNGNAEASRSIAPPTLEIHIRRALKGAQALQEELATLQKRNGALQRRLDVLEQDGQVDVQPRRGRGARPTVSGLQVQVQELKDQIKKLEKDKKKDKRKIEKLKLKEVKEDAVDLQEAAFEVGDTAYRMRKLLRRFHDLMLSPSLEEGEECPVCMESLVPTKCASLPCDHTFCADCIQQLSPGKDDLTCPQCRKVWPRDEPEAIQYTASQQWDALLDVAKDWACMDHRREDDTSEEEAEEEFIDDGIPDATSSEVSAPHDQDPLATSPEPEVEPKPQELDFEPGVRASPKRRRAVTLESSPEPDDAAAPEAIAAVPETQHNGTTLNDASTSNDAGASKQERPATPPNVATPLYAQSPNSEKRKRMEDLAARRSSKRSRY
ncbi:hypothetical protein BKA93DRAFT_823606 [Sparassis latifolia]